MIMIEICCYYGYLSCFVSMVSVNLSVVTEPALYVTEERLECCVQDLHKVILNSNTLYRTGDILSLLLCYAYLCVYRKLILTYTRFT